MLKFILFVLAGAVIYVLFSYVLRLFNRKLPKLAY